MLARPARVIPREALTGALRSVTSSSAGLDHPRAQAYWSAMVDEGILEPPFPPGDRRLCVATSEEDIDMTLEAASRALQRASSAL
jgi:glutamate-1-semialdehyde aminotransferase